MYVYGSDDKAYKLYMLELNKGEQKLLLERYVRSDVRWFGIGACGKYLALLDDNLRLYELRSGKLKELWKSSALQEVAGLPTRATLAGMITLALEFLMIFILANVEIHPFIASLLFLLTTTSLIISLYLGAISVTFLSNRYLYNLHSETYGTNPDVSIISFSPDCKYIAVAYLNALYIFDIKGNVVLKKWGLGASSVAWWKDRIAVGTFNGKVIVIKAEGG